MKKGNPLIWAILAAVILIAVGYFVWLKFQPNETSTGVSQIGDFKTVNVAFLAQLKELTACGNWPIVGISPSSQRNDPFARQAGNISPMAASSSQECLPANRK